VLLFGPGEVDRTTLLTISNTAAIRRGFTVVYQWEDLDIDGGRRSALQP